MKMNLLQKMSTTTRSIAISLMLTTCAAVQSAHANVTTFTSVEGPAVAVFNGKIFMAWTGTNSQHTIYLANSSDAVTWSGFYTLGSNTSIASAAPSLAVFNNKLYIAWTGGFNNINLASSSDGITFTNQSVILAGHPALGSTSLAVYNNNLYIAWVETDSQNTVYTSGSADGVVFSVPQAHYYGTKGSLYSPALSLFGTSSLALAFTTEPSPVTPQRYTLVTAAILGPGPEFIVPSSASPEQPYTTGPGIATYGNNFYVVWVGPNLANNVVVDQYSLSPSFGLVNEVHTAQTCIGNPAVIGFNGHVYYFWTGTDSNHHINWVQYQ